MMKVSTLKCQGRESRNRLRASIVFIFVSKLFKNGSVLNLIFKMQKNLAFAA